MFTTEQDAFAAAFIVVAGSLNDPRWVASYNEFNTRTAAGEAADAVMADIVARLNADTAIVAQAVVAYAAVINGTQQGPIAAAIAAQANPTPAPQAGNPTPATPAATPAVAPATPVATPTQPAPATPSPATRNSRGGCLLWIVGAIITVVVLVLVISGIVENNFKDSQLDVATPEISTVQSIVEKDLDKNANAQKDDEYSFRINPSLDQSTTGQGAFNAKGVKSGEEMVAFLKSDFASAKVLVNYFVNQLGIPEKTVLDPAFWVPFQALKVFYFPQNTALIDGQIVEVGQKPGSVGEIILALVDPDTGKVYYVRSACANPQVCAPVFTQPTQDYNPPADTPSNPVVEEVVTENPVIPQDTTELRKKDPADSPDPGPYNEPLEQTDKGTLKPDPKPEVSIDTDEIPHQSTSYDEEDDSHNVYIEDFDPTYTDNDYYDPDNAVHDDNVAPDPHKPGTHIADPDA